VVGRVVADVAGPVLAFQSTDPVHQPGCPRDRQVRTCSYSLLLMVRLLVLIL
jgi:hypothetical protein